MLHGMLTLDNWRELLGILLKIREQRDLFSSLSSDDWENFENNFGGVQPWASYYEVPLLGHNSLLVVAMGQENKLHQYAQNHDYDGIINTWSRTQIEEREGEFTHLFEDGSVAGMTIALYKSIDSLEIYGKSLNALIADIKDGDDIALFKVVRLDHSAVTNPTISNRITKAELGNDAVFFRKLSNALSGRPNKAWDAYRDTRYVLAVLHEMGVLNSLSEKDAYQLLCLDLKTYLPKGKDPVRNLSKLIERWKRENATTSNQDFMSSSSE